MNTLGKLINECAGTRRSAREAWGDAITMFACAISNAVDSYHYDEREELYLKTIQKYSAGEREKLIRFCAEVVAEMDKNPDQDLLGTTYEELGFCNARAGQFFTPYCVCAAMARISCGDVLRVVQEKGYCSINDPACGAGRTLIANLHEAAQALKDQYNWQDHILVTGQDMDWTVAMMCYINYLF